MFLGTVANFKNFSRPNKEIKYFSRKLTEFKDFERQLLKFETFSRLYEPWMDVAKSRNDRLFLLNPIQVIESNRGESLFTIFASLTYAYHYLLTLIDHSRKYHSIP